MAKAKTQEPENRRLLRKEIDPQALQSDDVLWAWRNVLVGQNGAIIRYDLENEILSTGFESNPYQAAYIAGKQDFAKRILLAAELKEPPKVNKNLEGEE